MCQQLLAALAARLGQVRQLLRQRRYEVANSRPSTGVRTSAERRQRPDNILLRSHLPRHLVDDLQQCHHAERQLQEQPQDLSRVTAPQCCQPSVCTRCGRYIDDSDACGRQLGVAGMPERPAASCSVKVVGPHTRPDLHRLAGTMDITYTSSRRFGTWGFDTPKGSWPQPCCMMERLRQPHPRHTPSHIPRATGWDLHPAASEILSVELPSPRLASTWWIASAIVLKPPKVGGGLQERQRAFLPADISRTHQWNFQTVEMFGSVEIATTFFLAPTHPGWAHAHPAVPASRRPEV